MDSVACFPQSAWAAVSVILRWILLDTGYFPWNNANPTYTYKDQLSKIVGGHNM